MCGPYCSMSWYSMTEFDSRARSRPGFSARGSRPEPVVSRIRSARRCPHPAPRLPVSSLGLGEVLALEVERADLAASASRIRLRPVRWRLTSVMAWTGLSRARSGVAVGASASPQHQVGGARLEQRGGLAHGRVADHHAQPPNLGGGVRLIAGVEERPGRVVADDMLVPVRPVGRLDSTRRRAVSALSCPRRR